MSDAHRLPSIARLPHGCRGKDVAEETAYTPPLTDAATVATHVYDPASKDLASLTYGTGAGTSALSVTDLLAEDQAGRNTTATWNVAGRLLSDNVTRSRAGRILQAVATDNATPTSDWSYTYDGAARLNKATLAAAGARPQTTLSYTFASTGGCGTDPAAGKNGSRTGKIRQVGTSTPQTSTYCTDNTGRLTAVTGADAATFTYDTRGNATTAGTQTWTCDGANRVVTAATTTPGGIAGTVRRTVFLA